MTEPKGQEFVYSLNTDGVEELVAGRIKLPPYILKPKVKKRGNMCVINLCSWTGVADGIKDPHYPADVASVKPLVAYLTGVVESLVHWEAFEMVANITMANRKLQPHDSDPIFGIFTSSFLVCSNNGDFKFHLDSKNSTFGINFSVVVDEEDTVPPVVWPALYLPDRNVVIPAVHGEAIVSMFKHEKHGTRMWHSGEQQFVEAAELAVEADTRKWRISLILADGMGTASWAVKRNQDRFVGSAGVEKRGVTFNINCDATRPVSQLASRPLRVLVLGSVDSCDQIDEVYTSHGTMAEQSRL
ncbi:hypothetical protein BDR26DRAFT_955317 [Obelidium mucronatum]|nr:hypothetical protein BDR26DRAFT_955317 [Obelidium mucronatum]